jgi:hypothetical protein
MHFGHFVHNPSGISRLRDLRLGSFGFFTKVAVSVAGGGVTAGSDVSSPSVFFVKEFVAIVKGLEG